MVLFAGLLAVPIKEKIRLITASLSGIAMLFLVLLRKGAQPAHSKIQEVEATGRGTSRSRSREAEGEPEAQAKAEA